MFSQLSIAIFLSNQQLVQSLLESLSQKHKHFHQLRQAEELIDLAKNQQEQIDCLIVDRQTITSGIFERLYEQGTLLPIVIIELEDSQHVEGIHHRGEVRLQSNQCEQINDYVEQAIASFLALKPSCAISEPSSPAYDSQREPLLSSLMLKQRQLAQKFMARQENSGRSYQRNSQYFYRHLSSEQQDQLLKKLRSQYRQIVLSYFSGDNQVNQQIDRFVEQAFVADLTVSQVLEIHMELMDEFSQQLKLEGRKEEILIDYRLTLIDVIAHLSENYRRSIPKANPALDFFDNLR